MADIIVSGIRKSFEQDRVVLDGISFQVDPGERVAILGGNGAGKTTLFRIMTGELSPDAGSVAVAKGRSVGYAAQINTRKSGDTVEDVLCSAYDGARRAEEELSRLHEDMSSVSAHRYDMLQRDLEAMGGYQWRVEMVRIANGLGIGPEMRAKRFDELSGGEQTRVNLARLIMEHRDILLLDEPTNHLDMASLEWLEDYLTRFKGTVLVVSHDRYFLDAVAERIIEIQRGKAEFYSGNYTYYAREKELRYRQQLARYNREQAKIKQLEFQIDRLKAWGSVYDNPALHKRAAAMERRIERVRQTDRPVREGRLQAQFAAEDFRADRVLALEDISKGFDGRRLFGPVTAQIRGGGERVALIGPNGAGKTTFLKVLLGELAPDSGRVTFGLSVRTAYLPQVVEFEHPERTLYDTMLYEAGCSPQEARDRLGLFRFSGEDQFKTVAQLSGGERSRLKLCIIMMTRANLLILDEPTNHLDLASREWIEEAVAGFDGTLLFVSHDRYFVDRFANRIWEIDGGFTDYPCDYRRYRRLRARPAPAEKAPAPAADKKEKEKRPAKQGRDPRAERRLGALEREIARREEELAAFDARMEAAASDYIELGRLEEEKASLKAEIDGLYAQWEETAALVETGGE